MNTTNRVKVWLTCPESSEEKVRLAIGDAGIGVIGNYTHCAFVSKGIGYSKPSTQANPHIGTTGEIAAIPEVVIEFVCEQEQLPLLKTILKDVHPYDEVALDIIPLLEI